MPKAIPTLFRHAYAVLAVLLATAIRYAADPYLGEKNPFVAHYIAVALIAWFGGPGPALLAIVLGGLAGSYFFISPRGSFAITGIADQITFAIFILVGLVLNLLTHSLRAALRRAGASEDEAREALRAERVQRVRLRTTLASIADAVITADPDGRVTGLNRTAEQLTGWPAAEAAGRPLGEVFRIVDEATRRTDEMPVAEVVGHGTIVRSGDSVLLVSRDGRSRPVEHSTAPIQDDGGPITGMVLVFRDVTERYRAERAIRESEQRFAGFMQHLPGLAWIKGARGRYVYANEAAAGAFGLPVEQLYGRTDDQVFPPETAAAFREHDRRAIETGSGIQVIETLEHPDGTVHHSLVSKFPIPSPDDGETLVGGMAIDITDRLEMEAALKEADRRKDEFLALLAHELRNPLAPIASALHLMKGRGGDADIEEERAMAERQVQSMARLIDDLMDVSRISRGKVVLRREVMDLGVIVARAAEAARPLDGRAGPRVPRLDARGTGPRWRATRRGWNRCSPTC